MNDALKDMKNRRDFLKFFGLGTVTLSSLSLLPALIACTFGKKRMAGKRESLGFSPVGPTTRDDLVLAEGLHYTKIIQWDDEMHTGRGDRFGFNNDYTQYFASKTNPDEGVLWVNHEYTNPLFIHGKAYTVKTKPRSKTEVLREMKTVGGSLVHIRRDAKSSQWAYVKNSRFNRKVSGATTIPFAWYEPIAGATKAVGTLGNCAGGRTPWGTVLTCEENYQDFYLDHEYLGDGKKKEILPVSSDYVNWTSVNDYPAEHYGWVVEVNPWTGAAKKLVAMGRFGHECATVREAPGGRCATYSGDDSQDRCIYKFVSEESGSLERGTLYVADLGKGQWIPLDLEKSPILKVRFKTQTEVLIYARQAAEMVGGTLCDRPEDIEICPKTGAVYVALTNAVSHKNFHGSILKIEESGNDPLALTFKSSNFITGGPHSGFSCPDNMVFDRAGNLWLTSDISGSKIGRTPYESFGNNGLFYIPMSGPNAGVAFQVGSAPNDAELTGPSFSPDGRTLFMSVQHPGETTTDLNAPTSHWPNGGTEIPRPAVVAIQGPLLDRLIAIQG